MKYILMLMLIMSTAFAANVKSNKNIVLKDTNTVYLNDQFNDTTVAILEADLAEKNLNLPDGEAINFVMNSPGGSVEAGLRLINFTNSLGRKFNVICIACYSMAFQTIQGVNGTRLVTEFGTLMAHKARGGVRGELPGQINNRLNYWLKRLDATDRVVVARTNGKQTLKSYKDLYENEYWCTGKDCINDGFADDIANVTCGKGLTGLRSQVYNTFIGLVRVYFSKCPLIDGIIKYKRVSRDDYETEEIAITPNMQATGLQYIYNKGYISNLDKVEKMLERDLGVKVRRFTRVNRTEI